MGKKTLEGQFREMYSEDISMLAERADLPAFKRILDYIAQQRDTKDEWLNQYCDYKDCYVWN